MKLNIEFLKLIILGANHNEENNNNNNVQSNNDNNNNNNNNNKATSPHSSSTTSSTTTSPTTNSTNIIENNTTTSGGGNNILNAPPQESPLYNHQTNITATGGGIPVVLTSKVVPVSSFSSSPNTSILTSCSPITFSPITLSHHLNNNPITDFNLNDSDNSNSGGVVFNGSGSGSQNINTSTNSINTSDSGGFGGVANTSNGNIINNNSSVISPNFLSPRSGIASPLSSSTNSTGGGINTSGGGINTSGSSTAGFFRTASSLLLNRTSSSNNIKKQPPQQQIPQIPLQQQASLLNTSSENSITKNNNNSNNNNNNNNTNNNKSKPKKRTLFEKLYTESGFSSAKLWYENNTNSTDYIIKEAQFVVFLRYLTDLNNYQILNLFDSLDKDDIGYIGFEEFFLLIAFFSSRECGQTTKFLYQHSKVMFEIISGGNQQAQIAQQIKDNNEENINSNSGSSSSNNGNSNGKGNTSSGHHHQNNSSGNLNNIIENSLINFDKFCKFGNMIGIPNDQILSYLEKFNTVIFDRISFEMFTLFYFVILDEWDRSSYNFLKDVYYDLDYNEPFVVGESSSNSSGGIGNSGSSGKTSKNKNKTSSNNNSTSSSSSSNGSSNNSSPLQLNSPIHTQQTPRSNSYTTNNNVINNNNNVNISGNKILQLSSPSVLTTQSSPAISTTASSLISSPPQHQLTPRSPNLSPNGVVVMNGGSPSLPLQIPGQNEIQERDKWIDSFYIYKLDSSHMQYIKEQLNLHGVFNIDQTRNYLKEDLKSIFKKEKARKAFKKALYDRVVASQQLQNLNQQQQLQLQQLQQKQTPPTTPPIQSPPTQSPISTSSSFKSLNYDINNNNNNNNNNVNNSNNTIQQSPSKAKNQIATKIKNKLF